MGEVDQQADLRGSAAKSEIARLRYEQALRLVDRQSVVLGELRTRASIVLSATGIVASLLGAEGLKRKHPFPWTFLPLIVLFLGLLSCIAVLMPVNDTDPAECGPLALKRLSRFRALVRRRASDPREWQVTVSASRLGGLAATGDIDSFRNEIVEDLQRYARRNYATTAFRSQLLSAACWLLLLQIILWMVVLWRLKLMRSS